MDEVKGSIATRNGQKLPMVRGVDLNGELAC